MSESEPPAVGSLPTSRVEAFSDGVFAVAITLLIIDIAVGDNVPDGGLWRSLGHLWFNYLAYAVSFLTIGVMWVTHHNLLSMLRGVDRGLMYRNVLLLAVVAFVPFPTAVVAHYVHGHGAANTRACVAFYGLVMVALGVAYTLLWSHVVRHAGIRRPDVAAHVARQELVRAATGTALYVVATAIAFVAPVVSLIMYTGLLVLFVLARPWPARAAP